MSAMMNLQITQSLIHLFPRCPTLTASLKIFPSRLFFNNMQKKTTGKRRPTRYLVGQSIYLTLVFYIQNNLYNCAAACAFGFLFSVIPVVMMVLAVLVRFLHASPKLIDSILQFASQYRTMFDASSFINSIVQKER